LTPLPNKNIDTGMGLERMAAVLQGKANNFEIDIFEPIVEQVAHSAGRSPSLRTCYTIADHIRAVTFAIADGVLPSNDQRGYVIRKLIRRAVWHGRALGIKKAFLNKIVPTVCKVMKPAHPELENRREEIAQVVKAEEERFQQTLNRAQELAEDIIAGLKREHKQLLPGDQMFRLYDTYGLPLETIESISQKHGFKLDKQGFQRELELQRKSSRKGAEFEAGVFADNLVSKYKLKPTKFIGDKNCSAEAQVVALFKDELPVKQAQAGETVKIVLDQTPFYGQSGGQLGDNGLMQNKKVTIEIFDTHKLDQTLVHSGKIEKGTAKLKDKLRAEIDSQRRENIARNHTATHLLQAALRKVLGAHVRQAGSWVGPDRLRFDFSHFQAVQPQQLQRVEQLVNEQIKRAEKVEAQEMSFEQAKDLGALAFFGEKYQEQVRSVKIGDISLELCGGTHVSSIDDIESFKIVSESSVASGIRRIEAVTKEKVQELFTQEQGQLDQLAQLFGVERLELPERTEQLLVLIKGLEQKLDQFRMANFKSRIDEIIKTAKPVGELQVITQEIKSAEMKLLRLMADLLRKEKPDALIVLGAVWEERPQLVCALGAKPSEQGLDAVKIIRAIAGEVEGSGGGRADFAQAGGRKAGGLKKALIKAEEIIREEVKS
ncbi:MAG: alanine--tRNA ligase, partial [Candidatus Omnitrophica bacterium]|nr:alanine--tRNA ligase [Candidatus Omnitrophota bacterium]